MRTIEFFVCTPKIKEHPPTPPTFLAVEPRHPPHPPCRGPLRHHFLVYIQESNFTELEKAFAEARRRSLAQAAEAKKQAAEAKKRNPPQPEGEDGAADKKKAVASKGGAGATSKVGSRKSTIYHEHGNTSVFVPVR